MPHLLIAGRRPGKSVGLNLDADEHPVSRHTDDVRMIMIDPKRSSSIRRDPASARRWSSI
jgi:DNA segregation ATPase FtsK/SpoIIIE-like protein